ncbi:MAG TPA: deoxyribonuclease V [Candidatus Paceibacterota bacterium]|nr:deoxyribonuclease V [Candidatus Paceibacterota bacterium]
MGPFRFDVTPKEAVALQKELRERVRLGPLERQPERIGGCDVSMNRFAKEGFAGFVTLAYPELSVIDHAAVESSIPFPYVPGLLSFREIPMLMRAWEKLGTKPDALMVDGIGIAHPRRLGIASHLGLMLGIPTIGIAKSVLTGSYEEPGIEAGSTSPLIDRKTNETIGMAVRTKRGVKPIFVSPGHLITLDESVELALSCVRKHRLPEPTRQAHLTVNDYRIEKMRIS